MSYYKRYKDSHQRVLSYWNPTITTNSLFTRILDILIFTSAIAITAYNYLTGTLEPMRVENGPVSPIPTRYHKQKHDFLMKDQKRKRTQEWALSLPSQPPTPTIKRRPCSTTIVTKTTNHTKYRTLSLPLKKEREEDEIFTKMEEQFQFLIQQGQEALSSPITL